MISNRQSHITNRQSKGGINIANIIYNSLKFLNANTDIRKTGGKKI